MISEYTNRLNVGRFLLEEVAKVLICKETVLLLFCFVFFFCNVLCYLCGKKAHRQLWF